jgi:uncharacterized membrane protein YbhN (UPF0104 family)
MSRARLTLGLIGTLGAFGLALWLLDWHALAAAFARFTSGVLLQASLFSVVTTLILALRWAILTESPRDRYGARGFHDALVGQIFNLITPAAVGADAYRVVVAGDRQGGRTRAMAMLVLERFVALSAYATAFLVAFAIGRNAPANPIMDSAALAFAAILVILLTFILGARHRQWPRIIPAWTSLERVHEAFNFVAILPGWRLVVAVTLTLAALASWLICVGIVATASGIGLSARVIVMITVVTECARLLPISIQGIGVREATFASLAAQAGGAAAPAFAACATVYALHFFLSGLVGVAARMSFHSWHPRRSG